jgi:hypothetical protein
LHYAKDLGRSLLGGQQSCAQEQAESQHEEPFACIHLFVLLLIFRQNINIEARIVPNRTFVAPAPAAGWEIPKGLIINDFPGRTERSYYLARKGIFKKQRNIQIIE